MAKGNMFKNYSSKMPMLVFLFSLALILGGIYLFLDTMGKNKTKESLTMRPKNITKDVKKAIHSTKRTVQNNVNKLKKKIGM
jgi:hypothetical protein